MSSTCVQASPAPRTFQKRYKPRIFPPVAHNRSLFVRLAPEHTVLFHALLESHGHIGYFTVLDRKEALLRLFFSPDQEEDIQSFLELVQKSFPLAAEEDTAPGKAQD